MGVALALGDGADAPSRDLAPEVREGAYAGSRLLRRYPLPAARITDPLLPRAANP